MHIVRGRAFKRSFWGGEGILIPPLLSKKISILVIHVKWSYG